MLNTLPSEIAIQVLWHLSQSDLLACLTVNQSLYRLVMPMLYRNVSSSDVSRVSRGLLYLCDNPTIAQHVRHVKLRIEEGCDNVDKLALIPHVAPNLHQLHVNADYDLPTPTQTEARCQRTLQLLSIQERGVSFVAGLLQSGTFTSLTHLHISFLQNFRRCINVITTSAGQPYQAMTDMGRKIIPCFLHTPALTALNISYAKFDLDDMEQLHNNLPQLKELTLINACFSANTANSMATMSHILPLAKLSSFHLTLRPDMHRSTVKEIERSLPAWLMYIEHKYTALTALTMEITDADGNEFELDSWVQTNVFAAAKNQMQRIIARLNGVDSIATQLFPFDEINVKICNKHELQTLKLFDLQLDIKTQLKNLCNSPQKMHIHSVSLSLCNDEHFNNVDALQHVFTLYKFDQLTTIDIMSVFDDRLSGMDYTFSLHLLQHVPSLEALKIGYINGIDREIPILPPNRLKSLDIGFFYIRRTWEACNQYLQAILQVSHLLETFNTMFRFGDRNCQFRFVIDMTGNKHLKSVCLEYFGSNACLILEHDSKRTERYWKTLTTSMEEPDDISEYTLIDLRWNDTTQVDAYTMPPPGHN